jgi:drug/metabolite transporter (DMT)-like permease
MRLRGIGYMLAGVFVFAIMDALMKGLSTRYGSFQVSLIRSLSSLVFVIPILAWRGSWRELRVTEWTWVLVRGLLGIMMLTSFVYGVRTLTLSQTYSLYLTAPLVMTALSVPIFKEQVRARRWVAIFAGLGGVLLILRPWQERAYELLPSAAILVTTLCYSLSALTVRSLSRTQTPLALVFWYLLTIAIGSAALAVHEWVPLRPGDWWLIAGIGLSGTLGQLWLTSAFSCAPPSVVGPFEYTALLWAFAIDRLVWLTSPSGHLVVGALIVIAAGTFIIEDERRMAIDTPP